jgi:hypothetical protein
MWFNNIIKKYSNKIIDKMHNKKIESKMTQIYSIIIIILKLISLSFQTVPFLLFKVYFTQENSLTACGLIDPKNFLKKILILGNTKTNYICINPDDFHPNDKMFWRS